MTFFEIEEEESDEKLKLLKQSYITENYKEETILNLQRAIQNASKEDVSKKLKLESYKKYNQALELSKKKYITDAFNLVEEALEINPKDVDILNLKGLLSLLLCKFSISVESFYTSMCYKKTEISSRYVDELSSEEFKVFLSRYNHAIRFINEELNQESTYILNNITEEESDLIEPYVILSLLYEKMGNEVKSEYYKNQLRTVDKGNPLVEIKEEIKEEVKNEENEKPKNKKIRKYIIAGVVVSCIVLPYMGISSMRSMDAELAKSEEALNQAEEEINKIQNELNEKDEIIKENEQQAEEEEAKAEAEAKAKEEEAKAELESNELESIDNSLSGMESYDKAVELKRENNDEEAILYFKQVIGNDISGKYKSQAMYEVAMLSEQLGDVDTAIEYYNRYIIAYQNYDELYDDALYNLGMIYYSNEDIENAQKIFHILKKDVPESMYYNSVVKEILAI